MKSYLSPHAKGLLDDIIDAIADAHSLADALRHATPTDRCRSAVGVVPRQIKCHDYQLSLTL